MYFCSLIFRLCKETLLFFDLINEEEARQLNGIELIASENFTSPAVMEGNGFSIDKQICRGLSGGKDIMVDVKLLIKSKQ